MTTLSLHKNKQSDPTVSSLTNANPRPQPLKRSSLEEAKTTAVFQNALSRPEGNADLILTPVREFIYCLIDFVGTIRQTFSSIQSIYSIATFATTRLAPAVGGTTVSTVSGAAIPFGLFFTGILCFVTGIKWTLRDACNALRKAEDELEHAKKLSPDNKTEVKKELGTRKKTMATNELEKVVEIERLGVVNQYFYTQMGAFQIAYAAILMLCPSMAKLFHYAPVLAGAKAILASAVTSAALGAVYTVRGGVMLARSAKNYSAVDDFHKKFLGSKDPIQFMKEAEKEGSSYLNRRVDESCLTVDENGVTKKYTASSISITKNEGHPNGTMIPTSLGCDYQTLKEKTAYLRMVDKGIYTEKLKHKVAMIIAGAMILGGILAIVLSILSGGGVALIAVGLASSLFFVSMEGMYLAYDSSAVFKWLRDLLYEKSSHQDLDKLLAKFESQKAEESEMLDSEKVEEGYHPDSDNAFFAI